MNREPRQLELELRSIGQALHVTPPELICAKTRAHAQAVITLARTGCSVTEKRQWTKKILIIILLTFPIPALFAWVDISAVALLFQHLFSVRFSEVAMAIYAWLRICLLVFVYLLLPPLLVCFGLHVRVYNPAKARMAT